MLTFDQLKKHKLLIWKLFYSRWGDPPAQQLPGYTVLLLMPGDLPVFLKIALEVITAQKPDNLTEILVIPDKLSPNFIDQLDRLQQHYPDHTFRLVKLNPVEQMLAGFFNRPAMNCWLQFHRGINATKTRYALWHDADLFITEPNFAQKHYDLCVERNLACLGVNKTWDSWFEENGFDHITATWELLCDVNWVRSFKPWEHLSHQDDLTGEPHVFDITYFPQCLTPPERIDRHQIEAGFVHFNYVISTYRYLQNSKGPFEDSNFRLLLIRLLVEAYDRGNPDYDLPSIDALPQGITEANQRVTYVGEETRQNYPEFRQNLQRLIDSGFLSPEQIDTIRRGVQPFDRVFGPWQEAAPSQGGIQNGHPANAASITRPT